MGRKKRPIVSQDEYNEVIKTIEENSYYKFSAGDDHSGAFLIPVAPNGQPYDSPFYCDWEKLKSLAEITKNKPLSLKGRT